MAKLGCRCGHVIVDNGTDLEHKGYILPDTYVDDVKFSLTDNMESLLKAKEKG